MGILMRVGLESAIFHLLLLLPDFLLHSLSISLPIVFGQGLPLLSLGLQQMFPLTRVEGEWQLPDIGGVFQLFTRLRLLLVVATALTSG